MRRRRIGRCPKTSRAPRERRFGGSLRHPARGGPAGARAPAPRPPLKLIAHRGWSRGGDENSLAAFRRAAGEPAVSGVEFDVRRTAAGRLIVSHDPPAGQVTALGLEAALDFLAGTHLRLFLELKEPDLAPAVLGLLRARGVSDRSTVFGFPDAAASMPWAGDRSARLGLTVPYPWQARRLVRAWRPDVLLLGWDDRPWTRRAFRAWWSVFSLEALGERATADVVVGVVRRAADLHWLRREGIEAAVADLGVDPGLPPARLTRAPG